MAKIKNGRELDIVSKYVDGMWIYDYFIEYYNESIGETVKYEGSTLAHTWDEAYQHVKGYYIEPEDEISTLHLEGREAPDGEVSMSFVIERKDYVHR